MPPTVVDVMVIVAANLIGAIPFAYLIVWWRRGIDIRTVGSGNAGATNAGRLLGFRFFLLIFALDYFKGFLTTWGLPRLAREFGGGIDSLPVLVAVATILGHNFPIYLGFRGGKGVSTSLGALSALDPVASAAAVAGFVSTLVATGFVSLSSVVGGSLFVLAHLLRTPTPWSASELPLTLALLGLLTMLIVRHRKNFLRIAAGTEPKVSLHRRRPGSEPLPSDDEAREGTPP